MGIDANSFRDGMRRLPASVTLLTSRCSDGTPVGLTATAVCSVSADPPILLCCLNRANGTYPAFEAAGFFAVNVLSGADQALAAHFATPVSPAERFRQGEWVERATGAPLLASAEVAFDCRVVGFSDFGSHRIFYGEVLDVALSENRAPPLLYGFGAYGSFVAPTLA